VSTARVGLTTTTDRDRIRTANILLVSIKALANEIAKNLVLAGIGSITLADHEVVTEEDLGAQFFISDADVGKNVCSLCFSIVTMS
jgi:ubiquitin-like 1-activating enzyme E1 A